MVNYTPFRISSHVTNYNYKINYLFFNWDHEENRLEKFREKSEYITLAEAGKMLEQATGRSYGRTAITNRIIRHNLGVKSNGKMSQWLIDRLAFDRFVSCSLE